MTELSLYVLDIIQNSVTAGATRIVVDLKKQGEVFTFRVEDDGCGMSPEFLSGVLDPFTTTRTTRRVGLGLPFLKQLAEQTGGSLSIESEQGVGTTLTTVFYDDHIDMVPMGDLTGTIVTLIQGSPRLHFIIRRVHQQNAYTLDTHELRDILGDDVPLDAPEVLGWLSDYLRENEAALVD